MGTYVGNMRRNGHASAVVQVALETHVGVSERVRKPRWRHARHTCLVCERARTKEKVFWWSNEESNLVPSLSHPV